MPMTLGTRLKLARVAHRQRQRDVAQRAGLSPSLLSDIENDWRRPTKEELERICAAIGVESGDLVLDLAPESGRARSTQEA